MMQSTTKPLSCLPFLLLACVVPQLATVSAGMVSKDDANAFAAAGHPMFIKKGQEDSENEDENIHERGLAQEEDGCTRRVVAVYESEYDVDYKHGDFQIGVTDLYRSGELDESIGKWWWDWAVLRGDDDDEPSYGTMMIEYKPKESITFGFSTTQTYYPISGGYVPVRALLP